MKPQPKRRPGRPRIHPQPTDNRIGFCLPPDLYAQIREAANGNISAFVRDVVVKHLEGM
jgi:hypothetical protein